MPKNPLTSTVGNVYDFEKFKNKIKEMREEADKFTNDKLHALQEKQRHYSERRVEDPCLSLMFSGAALGCYLAQKISNGFLQNFQKKCDEMEQKLNCPDIDTMAEFNELTKKHDEAKKYHDYLNSPSMFSLNAMAAGVASVANFVSEKTGITSEKLDPVYQAFKRNTP